jgi:hypothetical protein
MPTLRLLFLALLALALALPVAAKPKAEDLSPGQALTLLDTGELLDRTDMRVTSLDTQVAIAAGKVQLAPMDFADKAVAAAKSVKERGGKTTAAAMVNAFLAATRGLEVEPSMVDLVLTALVIHQIETGSQAEAINRVRASLTAQ